MTTRPRQARAEKIDHRVRVGRARSARTEDRILRAALEVFAEQGPDAPVVDDFVQAAGVSRGTFYNHFQGVPELLEATSVWTTDGVVHEIDRAIRSIENPALRVGTGIRLFLARAESDPVWCRFVARVWKLGRLTAPRRDLREGLRRGEFRFRALESALDVLVGALREALFRIGTGRVSREYRDEVVEMCLQALGTSPARVAQVLDGDLLPLAPPLTKNAARQVG